MKSDTSGRELGAGAGIGAGRTGESGEVRWIQNPMDLKKSMLFGNRETRHPKMEGRPGRARAPLRVYIALIFFLVFFPKIGLAEQQITDQEFGSDDYQQTLAIVARACPEVAQKKLHAREMLCACARELNEQTAELCRTGQGNDYACSAMRAACRGLK